GPAADIRDGRPVRPADAAGRLMCMLERQPESSPAGAAAVHAVLLRHATDVAELIDDVHSPARMYALAVGAPARTRMADTVLAPARTAETVLAQTRPVRDADAGEIVPSDDHSRGDLHRAVEKARHLADESRYHPAVRHLHRAVHAAVPLLGARDADVVDARIQLAGLRFESQGYEEAGELYRTLIDDLTAERGPYDDQVMFC